MEDFTTLIGQYNSSALTLSTGDYGTIALDAKSRIITDHETSSMKFGDGLKIISVLEEDVASVGGEKGLGLIAIRQDAPGSLVSADGDYTLLQVDANGRLRVDAEVSVSTGSDKEEDSAHSSGDVGCYSLGVRQDVLATDTSADGDYQSFKMNAKGELYVHDVDVLASIDSIVKSEDAAHVSGDKGIMALGVANEAEADLVSADGDYTPIATDKKGRLKVLAENAEQGTDGDTGCDESNDGEVDVDDDAFYDVVSIDISTLTTYALKAFDLSTDKLVAVRLVVWDSSQASGSEVVSVIRKLPVTENVAFQQVTFPRSREIAGGANLSLKLQAKCLRTSKTAHCGGGINGYTI